MRVRIVPGAMRLADRGRADYGDALVPRAFFQSAVEADLCPAG